MLQKKKGIQLAAVLDWGYLCCSSSVPWPEEGNEGAPAGDVGANLVGLATAGRGTAVLGPSEP